MDAPIDGTLALGGNLGDVQQNRRLRLGALMIALGLAVSVVMLELGAVPALRLAVFAPFLIGVNGIHMGLSRT